MSVNVSPDDVFWNAELFTAKLGMVSQIVFQKDWFAFFKIKVTVMDNIIKIYFLKYFILTADPFATKLGLMAHY